MGKDKSKIELTSQSMGLMLRAIALRRRNDAKIFRVHAAHLKDEQLAQDFREYSVTLQNEADVIEKISNELE